MIQSHKPPGIAGASLSTGSAAASRSVRVATGLKMHYVEQGDSHGEPILFVHGWPDSAFSYRRVFDVLPPSYRALALDLRGFGESDRPADGYSIDQLATDVTDFLDALGIGAATLVGHSMGSFVVRRVAEWFPTHVKRLVLIGSAVTSRNEVMEAVQQLVQPLSDPISLAFAQEFQAGTIYHPVPDAFFDGLVAESLKAPARVWQAAFDGLIAFDDAADLASISAPTLIVWGSHDGLFSSSAEQQQLVRSIPGAHLTIYPDAGHSPNWEFPERFVRDVTAFMQQTGLPAPHARHMEEACT
jgi:non-heme chloroperoxidase